MRRRLAVMGLLCVGIVSACGGSASPEEAAARACDHFVSAAKDFDSGKLTGKELKSRLAEISSEAEDAAVEIKFAAQHLSDAADAANEDQLAAAGGEMNSACQNAGEATADFGGGVTSRTFSCTAAAIASPGAEC